MSKYGIQITKPHSAEMYDWNDNIANIMKQEINYQIEEAYKNQSFNNLNELIVLCAGIQFSEGHSIEDLYEEAKELYAKTIKEHTATLAYAIKDNSHANLNHLDDFKTEVKHVKSKKR